MKRLLMGLLVALAFTGCKKSNDVAPKPIVYVNNPTPGSPAAILEASLVGNWIQTFAKVIFYNEDGTVYHVLAIPTPAVVKNYWQFYKPDSLNDNPTVTKAGSDLNKLNSFYYLVEIDNNVAYLDRFTAHPGDSGIIKISLAFPDKDDITATFIGIDPRVFLLPGDTTYKGTKGDLVFYYKRL
jgi:hypothetical protein